MFYFKASDLIMNFIYWGMKVFTKDRGCAKMQSFLFLLPLKTLFLVVSFHWSSLKNWLVKRMRPQLRSGREDKYLRVLLVFGWWSLDFFEPSVYYDWAEWGSFIWVYMGIRLRLRPVPARPCPTANRSRFCEANNFYISSPNELKRRI